ncbi:hypothetical protein THRCLA_11623 [Thraustotheca clavata]|uniref:CCHC-type domain-containing protein n=1 Tax=Thraustotheca clavata TaxID=74557 RepID=A0A1V9Y749_9STRA|nr:hypothetical protein THRCLA_11623 [Thraustotheca clavata]
MTEEAVPLSKTERRRAAKAKKKATAAAEKARRMNKREEMKQRRREKAAAIKNKDTENGCWICGDPNHRKQDCTEGMSNKSCFHCRRKGHDIHSCPKRNGYQDNTQPVNDMCFNCGEKGHSLWKCPKPKVGDGTSFASCFVCGATGHLSSRCPMSENGIYPKGGCCKVCGSKMHLAKNCPEEGKEKKPQNTKKTFADDDDDDEMAQGAGPSNVSGDYMEQDDKEEEVKPVHSKANKKLVKF